ncbi:DUF4276 domain-containing protein [Actinomyces slackii]|uniref:DUF4276 family protein n=1 Tax=Actinomyces slackii TaxID=52774 RepID=A0A3S4SUU8_9ACTO|nr:DUF4276 family protein [Actinomyces slackii]VEG75628.1 Uncharacterised protein [Actinomyces slackii]
MTRIVASVVEGHGEVKALPELLRRITNEAGIFDSQVAEPFRLGRDHMRSTKVRDAVRMQWANINQRGGIGVVVVLYDSDDDDPQQCVKATREALEGQEAVVAVAVREYEAWFLAGIESLRDHRAVKDDAAYPKDPEAKRGAKEALQEQMIENYAETRHQVAFSSRLDLDATARRSPSFARFREQFLASLTAA